MLDQILVRREKVAEIARKAGDEILKVYAGNDVEEELKSDNSPLTKADKISHHTIVEGLQMAFPDIPILSEESKEIPYEIRGQWGVYWLVDPLDGTKEFLKKNGEFTVNIALISDGQPMGGVVYVPVTGVLYQGWEGIGAEKSFPSGKVQLLGKGIYYKELPHIRIVASRSHRDRETEQFIKELEAQGKTVEVMASGSSIKFCLVAENSADVYPRFGPTCEWDTAAAHAVCKYAGREVLAYPSLRPLHYNKRDILNPPFIVQ